jgi:3-hydroxyacyl-CoA dehydrogenase
MKTTIKYNAKHREQKMDQPKHVSFSNQGNIGIICIDYAPVNALSQSVRQGIVAGLEKFEADSQIKAVIISCAKRTFIAGADIKEFGKAPTAPFLPDVVNRIEASSKPVIAAMFGTSLGGGFEVALACHYRVALNNAKVGMPEVNLGLIPGAGGTQRLVRMVGAEKALAMITSGKHYGVNDFDGELFDALFDSVIDAANVKESDLTQACLEFVSTRLASNTLEIKRVGDMPRGDQNFDWKSALTKITKSARGKEAPVVAAKVLEDTQDMDILSGMGVERAAFLTLRESAQSAALIFAFGAEKKAAKTNLNAQPLPVNKVGIIGGGNMGSGIATAFLMAGYHIILIEQNPSGLDAGLARINKNFQSNVKRKRISQAKADSCLAKLDAATDYQTLADCDLVIEAVFEDIAVKKELFNKLDKVCRQDCIFATNTSYLDINEIAASISRPQQVIGMHFFSPANIMKLLEVVRAEKSSDQAIASAMAVAKKLKKISVLVGVCFGFAGNRMYTRYGREVQQMLLEGAKIEQIDQAMTDWGMAMGPLAVQDMSGIDIGHNARSAQPFPAHDVGYFRAAATMVEHGRLGRKTAKGFYQYDENGKAVSDTDAALLINNKAADLSINQKTFSAEQIVERAILALISEGLELFKAGIVQRLSDIDVIWLHGYGFPRHKGGPMFQAQQMGKAKVTALLSQYRELAGADIWPEVDVSLLEQ